MKTLEQIKDEVAQDYAKVNWFWLLDENKIDLTEEVAERYASQSEELISSLKGEIAELKSEIITLKANR